MISLNVEILCVPKAQKLLCHKVKFPVYQESSAEEKQWCMHFELESLEDL